MAKSSCPICDKPMVATHSPFCSAACKSKDLLNWIDGRYTVPAQEVDDGDLAELEAGLVENNITEN